MQKLILAVIILAIQLVLMIKIEQASTKTINSVLPSTPAQLAVATKLPPNLEEIMEVNK